MNATLKFAFEKETKGAVRYQEVGDDGTPNVAETPEFIERRNYAWALLRDEAIAAERQT